MKKRYPEFDVAKAIALAGVIIGHSTYLGTPDRLASVFYSFDMPLFFIVSGFFSKPEAKLTPDYVRKNAKSLLMPYLITCIGVIGCSFLGAILTGKTNPAEIANHWFMAGLYGCGGITPATPAFVSAIGALWQNAPGSRKPISTSRNFSSGPLLLRQRFGPNHLASLEYPSGLERNALFVHWTDY